MPAPYDPHDIVIESDSVYGQLYAEPNPVGCEIFRHSMDLTLAAWARLSRRGLLDRRADVRSGAMSEQASPRAFGDDDRPRAAASCHVRELEGEQVVYDPERCDGTRSVADLLAELAGRFDAPEEVLRRDLVATLGELRAKKLVS